MMKMIRARQLPPPNHSHFVSFYQPIRTATSKYRVYPKVFESLPHAITGKCKPLTPDFITSSIAQILPHNLLPALLSDPCRLQKPDQHHVSRPLFCLRLANFMVSVGTNAASLCRETPQMSHNSLIQYFVTDIHLLNSGPLFLIEVEAQHVPC